MDASGGVDLSPDDIATRLKAKAGGREVESALRLLVKDGFAVVLGSRPLLAVLFAWGIALAGTVSISTMVLATAPGGMAEMCVTAKVLQLGVPLVTAAHVTRVIILVTTTAPMFRLAKHLRRSLRA